jgi:hypothetical protein
MKNNLLDSSILEKYVNSMYYAITTMATVGYGDIHSNNSIEIIAAIICEIIAGVRFAYTINKIGQLFG